MKIKFILCIAISICVLLSSCSKSNDLNSNKIAKEQCNEIVRCLNKKDSDGLKNMFCETVKSSTDVILDEQIENIFSLFNNKEIVSYENIIGSESVSVDDSKITKLEVYPIIRPVKLANDEEYEIYFYSYIICEENTKNEGISQITIVCDDNTQYKIGNAKFVHPNI